TLEKLSLEAVEARIETLACRVKVIPDQAASLAESPLSIFDIYLAIEGMKPHKTPGLDDLPA
ncbi:hypothetical protein GOP47_0017658, partial [Adiantum capillus-veneris]